jgi:hypothetical protein
LGKLKREQYEALLEPLGHKPLKEKLHVLQPIPDYPVG